MKQLQIINPENVTEDEVKNYRVREAARAVVIDQDGKIAMLHVSKENYYKLPGGGVKEGEDILIALDRECKEEIGCEIEVLSELGMITEYRKIFGLKQTSYCYMAKLKGEKGIPEFTKKEDLKGFKEVWLSYKEAVLMMKESQAVSEEGRMYIVPRDMIVLEEAKNYLN